MASTPPLRSRTTDPAEFPADPNAAEGHLALHLRPTLTRTIGRSRPRLAPSFGYWVAAAFATLVVARGWPIVRQDLRGLTLVVRAADLGGPLRRLADLDVVEVGQRIVTARTTMGSVPVRLYSPRGRARQSALLVPGLNPLGIDDPRFVRLATRLAEAGVTVATPRFPALARFEITSAITDSIEAAAVWLSSQPDLSPDGRIGLMGVSFSGGLVIVAAGRPALRDHLRYVFSFGGYDDLRRVLDTLCTGTCADGRVSNDYAVTIVVLNLAAQLVPPSQLDSFQAALRRFLTASNLVSTDERAAAATEFAALRDLTRRMPEPAATLMAAVNNRDVESLGRELRPLIDSYVDSAALSPTRSPAPSVPLFLLHGRDDTVIPAAETQRIADRLRAVVPVRLLLTTLISHADADKSVGIRDVYRLASFWGDLLDR